MFVTISNGLPDTNVALLVKPADSPKRKWKVIGFSNDHSKGDIVMRIPDNYASSHWDVLVRMRGLSYLPFEMPVNLSLEYPATLLHIKDVIYSNEIFKTKSFKSEGRHELPSGRTVHMTASPADEDLPKPGEVIHLNGKDVRVISTDVRKQYSKQPQFTFPFGIVVEDIKD